MCVSKSTRAATYATAATFDKTKFVTALAKDLGKKEADITDVKVTDKAASRRALLNAGVDVTAKVGGSGDYAAASALATKTGDAASLTAVASDVGAGSPTPTPAVVGLEAGAVLHVELV